MIPPTRVFRTSETSSIQMCKGQCIEEGMRCQSFALGISTLSGNGTCQLSSERVFENGGRRPRNTIYDPEFNLYQRIENCYGENGAPSKPDGSLLRQKKNNNNNKCCKSTRMNEFSFTFFSVLIHRNANDANSTDDCAHARRSTDIVINAAKHSRYNYDQ